MEETIREQRIAAIRRFSRFYTRRIGVLHEGLLGSPYSLTEGRIIYELAQHAPLTASDLGADLGLDAGYMSRVLKGLEDKGILARRPSPEDARRTLLSLTEEGQAAFAQLNARSHDEIGDLLDTLPEAARQRLVSSLETAETLLSGEALQPPAYLLRPHRPGDIGWVIQRHAELYAEEYGWDISFEALVAEVAATFLRNFDPAGDCCWMAEIAGERVGSAFVVRQDTETAKLRLVIVDPKARGLGIGARLVEECLRFARQAGYRRMILWTNDVLHAARHIYVKAGFRLVASEPHHSFGKDLVGETWERDL
ncbi:bifunctional helix-turn-helix transcriptional regulator/GNAT family N-acetyltransferase [Oceanibaculum sp.]|uniref:bifunctional helix-turn-helix transcriptional regulator/GNAT family N-acetyltransferase n=1 Tax=Oceanibaculum sp. TaxID=1903597 RepID=UPI0025912AF5|nr:bifunctional helix-turn-helix transcriptional regulator/GNAT family N-acetyltransferase [Oceanibaculum sp.]MCH2393386.1 bifunctional helix-turn-helix transcriptional regulator/GNAT family N-acetyltransferase [Oceanibaculum sp.]